MGANPAGATPAASKMKLRPRKTPAGASALKPAAERGSSLASYFEDSSDEAGVGTAEPPKQRRGGLGYSILAKPIKPAKPVERAKRAERGDSILDTSEDSMDLELHPSVSAAARLEWRRRWRSSSVGNVRLVGESESESDEGM